MLAILIATLWPFDFFPTNKVSWLPETNGIRFDGSGVVVSNGPLSAREAESRNSCSLEVLLRPAGIRGVHTILSFYAPANPRQFRVRQYRDALLVSREFVGPRGKMQPVSLDLGHFFQQGQLLLLTITSGPNGTVVYRNGRQAHIFSGFGFSHSDLAGQIVVGTSAVGYEPWQGEVRGLAIYSKELTPEAVLRDYNGWTDGREVGIADLDGAAAWYAFTERTGREIHSAVASGPDLEIPKNFVVPDKPFLESLGKAFKVDWMYVDDVSENIAGFVPLGLVVCVYLAGAQSWWRAVLYTILAAGALSFSIEVLQFYIPQRSSDMTDIVTNTLGAALGAVLARPSIVRSILERTMWITPYGNSPTHQD
jgi:hypothetical protein